MKKKGILQLDPKKIVVRMPNWIGDIVMAIPILEDLSEKYPHSYITAMCKKPFSELLKNNPNVDEIFSFEKAQKKEIIKKLRSDEYNLGVLLTNSFSSAWLFFKGRIKNRIGYKGNLRNWLLNYPISFSKNRNKQHIIITYKELIDPLNISNRLPKLFLSREENEKARKSLYQYGYQPKKRLIGINANAAYGSAKCWPLDRFEKVAKKLLEDEDNYVVFIGNKSSLHATEHLCRNLNNRVINLAGKTTIRELIGIINNCDLFLTNDSGPMHIASALKVPLLAVFGSTSDIITGPFNGDVINKRVACSPCFRRECNIDFRCMKSIEVNDVVEKTLEMLNKKKYETDKKNI